MALNSFYRLLFRSIRDIYHNKLYCDVKLMARRDEESTILDPVYCHSLVLCSVAPAFKEWLLDPCVDRDDSEKCVFLPDLTHDVVQKFMDDVYNGLCSGEFLLDITYDLANVFGMMADDSTNDAEEEYETFEDEETTTIILPGNDGDDSDGLGNLTVISDSSLPLSLDNKQLKDLLIKGGQLVIQDGNTISFATSTPVANRGVKRKLDNSSGYSLSNKKINLAARVIQGPLRYNTKLSMYKSNFSSISELQEGFFKQEGMFRAKTDSYYANSKITMDKESTIKVGETRRPFRMRLPSTSFVALVAVGVRRGSNVVSTLSCNSPNWPAENTFANMIDMTKSMCGTSFGAILRHPRCAEVNKEKISREMIDRFKEEYKKLNENERNSIAVENQKYLKEFDTEASLMEFHHLPQKSTKMEFTLVSDLTQDEILDYAIVSGNSCDDLVIQSFINFNYQKFTAIRLVTVLCDTLSCFLWTGNEIPLSQSKLLKDTFENYATRTCQLLAVQELGVRNRDVCIDLIDNTSTSFQRDPDKRKRSTQPSGLSTSLPVDNVKKKFPCTEEGCSRSFAKESQRNAHLNRVHSGTDGGKLCQPCNKVLKNDREYKDHIYYHHSKKECKICNMTFPGAYLFYYHNSKVHFEVFTCDVCGQEFRGKEKLKVHKINKHLEDHQKPYVCSICGKGYAHKTKLESHQMNVHIRSRPYKCRLPGCDADFNELANRNAHEKNVHKLDSKKILHDLKSETSDQDVEITVE